MNNLTPIVCEFCNDVMPLAVEDRVAAPILVDMTVRLHLDVCDRIPCDSYSPWRPYTRCQKRGPHLQHECAYGRKWPT